MKQKTRLRLVIAILGMLITMCGWLEPAWAQEVTSSISGTVTDPQGGVVPDATVTAKDVDRGTSWTATTNSAGFFDINRIPVGNYAVTATAAGFKTSVHPPVTLVLNQHASINFQLQVGTTATNVEVTATNPLLQTQTTELGSVISSQAAVGIPLATRNYNQLTLLSPGAVSTNPGSFTGPQATFQSGRPYINGNREQANNYLLDGMDNNQIDNNDVAYAPSVDAIQEFNIITQNPSAEFGNFMGGIINVTLKSGTNQFHGDVFWFIRNDIFNANTWSNNLVGAGIPKLRWNEFGATIGGPIVKDKLFFFADYQGSRFDQPNTPTPINVFTAAERTGDFGEFCTANGGSFNASGICSNPAHQLYNPTGGGAPSSRPVFAFNRIPSGSFNSSAFTIMNSPLMPTPINGATTKNAINLQHLQTNGDQGDIKVDFMPGSKDHLFARYSQQYVNNPITNSFLLLGNLDSTYPLKNGVIDWTHTVSSTMVNDLRFGASYFPATIASQGNVNPTGQNLPAVFGIAGVPSTLLPVMNFSGGFLSTGAFGSNDLLQRFNDTVFHGQEAVTLTKGTHEFHFGFEGLRYRTNIFYPGNEGLAGTFTFSGQFTGNGTAPGMGEADFLLGLPSQLGLGANTGFRYLNNSLFAAFAEDNWRVKTNLTLNLGLRYEVVTPRAEQNGLATNYTLFGGAVELAGVNGNTLATYSPYWGITNFQPRVGLAWSPMKNTVVRAAYGITNFEESTGTGNLPFQNPPFAIAHNQTTLVSSPLPASNLSQGFSAFPASGCTPAGAVALSPACFSGAVIHAFDPRFRPAVSQQWNLSVQQQLGNSTTIQVGYVGQKNQHLADIFNLAQRVLGPGGTISPSIFLNPTLLSLVGTGGQARFTGASAYGNYNALQVMLQQRLTNGLTAQVNYTWSKCLANSSGFFGEFGDTNPGLTQAGNGNFFFQNTYDPAADYGLCPNDVASNLNGYLIFDLPFGRGRFFGSHMNSVVNAVVGDWTLNSDFIVHSGFSLTATNPTDSSNTNSFFPRADCVPGVPQGTAFVRATGVVGFQFLNPAAVAAPPANTFGNCAVGSFRGPGLTTGDVGISKLFPIREHTNLELRAEAINITNTPIFAAPSTTIGPTFGVITQSQGPRNLQFAAKVNF